MSSIYGFAIRLSIPLIVGFLIGRIFGLEGELAASVGASAAALALCWPVIVLWDIVVVEGFRQLYGQFMLLYFFYCLAFFYMARIGALFGIQVSSRGSKLAISLSKIIESALIAIIGGVGTKFVEHLIIG